MAEITVKIPVDADTYYLAETESRHENLSLADALLHYIAGMAEQAEDRRDMELISKARAEDDGTRYSSDEVRRELGL
jgi:hypothetical protein